MKRQRIIYAVIIGIISCIAFTMLIIMFRPTPAEKICHNLINAGYYNDEGDCVLTGNPPNYIGAMLPLYEADMDYVRLGMDDFRISFEKKFETGDTIIVYELKGRLIWFEFYKFRFDENGMLISTEWQN